MPALLFLLCIFFLLFWVCKRNKSNKTDPDSICEVQEFQIATKREQSAKMTQISVDPSNLEIIQKSFIAFDVETTGLDCNNDRIIEVGATLFVDGIPDKSFSSLVNANVSVSHQAYAVNHISNEMLQSAPREEDVYPRLIEFLGGAINGDIIMCAHNAQFDFNFLRSTFSRLGYKSNIKYIDTLGLARQCVKGIPNYKQQTLETYFGLQNDASHRAETDAENCGKILCELLKCVDEVFEDEVRRKEYSIWMENALTYWNQGEAARKDGRFDEAFELYDKAKAIGHAPWFLYEGYAKAYRKLEDYESELKILDEGIATLGHGNSAALVERRDKLRNRLAARDEAKQIAEEKALEKERKAAEKLKKLESKAQEPKKPIGRSVVQMDDNGSIIKEFESIAAAAKETGVNNKSIRCAANGTQKHAGGYCWKYKD